MILSWRRSLAVGLIVVLGVCSWWLWRAFHPSPAQAFEQCLGLPVSPGVTDLQGYLDYRTIDPAYFLRFRADSETMKRVILWTAVPEDTVVRSVVRDRSAYRGSMPVWWKPEEITSSRTWTYDDRKVIKRLRIDEQAGLIYVEMLYH